MRSVTLSILVAVSACADGDGSQLSELGQRGKLVFEKVCTACHHGDPTQDGALGPAVAGASLELLEAKLLRGEYPPGYAPKRQTLSMPVFDYLADDIPALAVYLAELR